MCTYVRACVREMSIPLSVWYTYHFCCLVLPDSATARLAEAINACDLQGAYDIIKAMDIEKIAKAKRVYNVAINYYGDLNRQESVEEVPAEDKDEFKCVH